MVRPHCIFTALIITMNVLKDHYFRLQPICIGLRLQIIICSFFLISFLSVPSNADDFSQAFTQDWRFAKVVERPTTDSDKWESINLPHTWNAIDASNGGGTDMQSRDGYYRGPGWYSKTFHVDKSSQGKRLFLRFEGVSSVADVYLNGKHLGQHRGAFGAFCFEITGLCKQDSENLLLVRADNTWRKEVAPLSGDFAMYGGIYRPVSLITKETTCIDPLDYASSGIYISQKNVSKDSAEVTVLSKLDSALPQKSVKVDCRILDHTGEVYAEQSATTTITNKGEVAHEFSLENPHLWNGRSDPYLYTVEITLWHDGKILDTCQQSLGLRSYHIDPEKGFFLNGKPYKLYGVNRHQDRAGKGWAVSSSDHAEDIQLIEEIGARGLRLAHYPQASEAYQLCDEAGILVWAELPLVDCITEGPAFAENAKQQLRELIRQHYNHPSIFCWSLFNEMYHRESADFTSLLEELNSLSKAEDPYRLTIGATNKLREKLCNVTDALAFNKYPGWYGGGPEEMHKWLAKYNELGNHRGICVSEYGAGASIKHHEQNPRKAVPKSRWHPEEWQAVVHEGNYQSIKNAEYCWGSFVWNMFDFASVWRTEGDADGINDKGLVSYDRKVKKDAFYFYKTNWSDSTVLHITSKRHTNRKNAKTPIKIYANSESVDLFVNDEFIGTREPNDICIAKWDSVELQKGENSIRVEASVSGNIITDTCTWNVDPKHLRIINQSELNSNPLSISH